MPGHTIRTMLGPGKHQRPRDGVVVEEMLEHLRLARLFNKVDGLHDGIGGDRRGRNLNTDRLSQDFVCQFADLGRHGRREQQCLPLRRDLRDNPADVADEPHVQHAVGLVEDQHLHML